jgi:hypothetical protein
MLEIKTTSIDSFVFVNKNNGLFLKLDENNAPVVKEKGGKRKA